MSLGRAAWTATRQTQDHQEQPAASSSASATSNADLLASLTTHGEIAPADPQTPVGLTPGQVGVLGSFGIGVETLDDEAQRRLGHALGRMETLASCDAGDEAAGQAVGPEPAAFTRSTRADGGQQSVVTEEADYRLTLWTETDPVTGQQVRHLLYEDVDGTFMSGLSSEPAEVSAAPIQEPAQAPEPTSEEGIASFLEGALEGDFTDNRSWSALAGQVAVGFVPYVGQVADIRDLVAAGQAFYEGKENAGWQLLLSGVGVVPGVGDALKAAGKVALGGAAVLGTAAMKHGDELAEGAEGLAKHGDEAAALAEDTAARLAKGLSPETLTDLSTRLGPDGLAALARGMDAEALTRTADKLDADTLAALVGKGLDGHAIRELADSIDGAELKALAEAGTADAIAAAASILAKERLSTEAAGLRSTYLKRKPAPDGGNAAVAELTLDDGTRLASQATSKKVPMDRPRSASDGPDPVTGQGGHYEPTTHQGDYVRRYDSEYKILSDLTDQLATAGREDASGVVSLYTERAPCDSCLSVIQQFERRFPGIKVRVFSDFTVDGAPQ